MEEKKFINPYNFIPFPQKKNAAYEDQDRHTGVITYQITTKTPLFIPNTSNEDAFLCDVAEHKSYDFFSYHELRTGINHRNNPMEPVIPGSELRGMIRGIYETLTDSCVSVFNDELYPERRTKDVFTPGLIRKVRDTETKKIGYELYEAKKYQYSYAFGKDETKEYSEGAVVSFRSEFRNKINIATQVKKAEESSLGTKGYLIKGEAFGEKKKHCYIFQPSKKGYIMELDDMTIKRLKAVIESYQSQPNPKQKSDYREYQKELDIFLRGEGNEYFPVRYSFVEDFNNTEKRKLLYLSPAAITKEIANTSLKEVLGGLTKCETYQKRCPACDLFGMIGNDHNEAIGTKVRFSDARVTKIRSPKEYYDRILTRETLGTPKLSNPEFYLQRPDGADAWNYDYYVANGQIHLYNKEVPLKLRGRKYYVHQPEVSLPPDVEKTKSNVTIRPVSTGITFQGKVFFENISQKQIDQLIWILNGGSEEEVTGKEHLWYKLGSGKPLGFGSVELQVCSCEERIVSLENNTLNYQKKTLSGIPKSYDENDFSMTVKKDFIAISTYDYAKGSEVTYPSVIGGTVIGTTVEKGFEWFGLNKGNGVSKRNKSVIKAVLPTIQEKYLEKYEPKSKDNGWNHKNSRSTNQWHKGKNNSNNRKR